MKNIKFKSGKVIYDEFHIDFSIPFSEQLDNLKEDLLQVVFTENFLLDIGWYPEYEPEGQFVVQLIQNKCWDNPRYRKHCKDELELRKSIERAVELAGK